MFHSLISADKPILAAEVAPISAVGKAGEQWSGSDQAYLSAAKGMAPGKVALVGALAVAAWLPVCLVFIFG